MTDVLVDAPADAPSRVEEFGRNSFGVAVAAAATALGAFGTSLVTARWLGPHGRGEYSLAVLLPTVSAILAELGLGYAAAYHVARRRFSRPQILGNSVVLSLALGVVAAVVCGAIVLPLHATLVSGLRPEYMVLALLAVPFVLLARVLGGVLMGAEDFRAYTVGWIATTFVPLLALLLALVVFHLRVAGAVAATTVAAVIVGLAWLAWTIRVSGGVHWQLDRGFVRAAGTYGLQMHAENVLTFLGYRLDVFLVNGFLNPAAVGLYTIAAATAERVFTLAEASATVLFPRAVALDPETRNATTPLVARNVFWTSAVGGAALFALAQWLVPLFYSGRFDPSVGPLRILIVGIVLATPARVLQNDISARGRPLLNSYVAGVTVAANVVANVFLIPADGIRGAAWASVISYSLYSALTVAVYRVLSGNSLATVLVPRRTDLTLLRRAAGGLLRRG